MGVIKDLQDFFTSKTKEYKNYIQNIETTSPEEWYQDGERKFTKKELNFERIYDKERPFMKKIYDDNGLNILLSKRFEEVDKPKEDLQTKKEMKSETIKKIPFPDGINDFDFTEKIKEELLKGKGVIGKINGFDYYIRFTNKSKTEKNHGNLQVLTIEKAKKFGLIPKEQKEDQKNTKTRGLKV